MKQPEISIPKFTEVASAAQSEIEQTEQSAHLVDDMNVADNDSLETAARWLAAIKSSRKEIDAKRKSFVKPLQDVVKDLNGFFKPALNSLDAMEKSIKSKITQHIETALEQRNKLLDSVKTETKAERKTEIIQVASKLEPKIIEGITYREQWTGEVEDFAKIVDWGIENKRADLLQPNKTVLESLTAAHRKDIGVPGWRAYLKRIVVVNSANVK